MRGTSFKNAPKSARSPGHKGDLVQKRHEKCKVPSAGGGILRHSETYSQKNSVFCGNMRRRVLIMAVAVLFCSIGLGAQNNPYKIDDACYEIMSRAPDWALASAEKSPPRWAARSTLTPPTAPAPALSSPCRCNPDCKKPGRNGRALLCAGNGTIIEPSLRI